MDRLYVSGLWIIKNNAKRSSGHYYRNLPSTIEFLKGSRLIFYYDNSDILSEVSRLASKYQVTLEPMRTDLQDLPCWDWAVALADSCEAMQLDQFLMPENFASEKGVVHYWRDLKKGGRESYIKILAVWLSKISLVTNVMHNRHNESIAWVDASISRFKDDRENWNFSKVGSVPGCISHYGNRMRFHGRKLPLNASYLEGDKQAWTAVESIYYDMLPRAARTPYGHDEETVLAECIAQFPGLFHCIGQPLSYQRSILNQLLQKVSRKMSLHKKLSGKADRPE